MSRAKKSPHTKALAFVCGLFDHYLINIFISSFAQEI